MRFNRPTTAERVRRPIGRTACRSLILALALSAGLLFASAPALAADHPFVSSFTGTDSPDGSLGATADKVAVRQSDGNVYVIDKEHGVVDTFDSTGAYVSQVGPFTFGGDPDLAVDNSATGSEGNLYVLPEFGPLSAFDSSGTPLYQLDGTTTPGGSFGDACGAAVDSSGNVYVVSFSNQAIYKFDSAGNFLETINVGFSACDVAVDSDGTIYLIQFNNSVHKLDATGTDQGVIDSNTPKAVNVDPSNHHVYVAHDASVSEYDSSGSSLGDFGGSVLQGSRGVDVNGSSGNVYVSSNPIGGGSVAIFGPAVALPTVTTGNASNVLADSATLNGHVDPAGGGDVTDCHFEYGTDTSYGSTAPCVPATPISSAADVSADVNGLASETTYHFRLVAANANGSSSGADQTFTTPIDTTPVPPDIENTSAGNVGSTSAVARAQLTAGFDPDATFHVEYGTDTNYGSTTPDAIIDASGGNDPKIVSASLSGLDPSTTYHFRFVAQNTTGTTEGPDMTFTTRAAAADQFGISSFSTDASSSQAGAHADVSTAFTLNTDELGNPINQLKDVRADLPPGLVGNPQNIPACSHRDFENFNCSFESEVGVLNASFIVCKGVSRVLDTDAAPGDTTISVDDTDDFCADSENNEITIGSGANAETAHIAFFPSDPHVLQLDAPLTNSHTAGESVSHQAVPLAAPIPLFNLDPMPGHTATLAASLLIATIIVNVDVRPDGGLTATISDTSTFLSVASTKLTLWGVPSDPSHDALRCSQIGQDCGQTGRTLVPFMTNPTNCSGPPLETHLAISSWQDPGTVIEQTASQDAPTGCNKLAFDPSVSFTPTVNAADSPSGFAFNLHVPQDDEPYSLATPALRTAAVTLPEGVSVNPSSADGLGACTQDQFGLGSDNPVTCSNASKIGSAEIVTPLLADPLEGSIYLATPNDNPFGSLLAVYVVAEGSNVLIKLAGRIDADPDTGQLTTTFQDNPQVPFSDLNLTFFAGQRGALATPKTCGTFQTTAELTPWSAPDSGAPATPSSSFDITSGPSGSGCSATPGDRPFDPGFVGGTIDPVAGAFTPFTLKVTRADGNQELSTIDATLASGVSAKLAGVPLCTGTAAANGTCAAASQVGAVDIAAGAGSNPFHLAGTVYLTGPYKGAPLGLSIVTQAVAGPLDLGKVVVRAAVFVDPRDAHLSVASDPLPTILAGIPLRLRSVRILMNRANFIINPTNCSEMAVTGEIGGSDGATADVSNRFQVGECRSLGFQPTLIPRVVGGKPATKPGKNPGLDVELSARPADANIKTAAVTLPNTLTLDSTHLGLFCSQQQLETNACPPESQFGSANATSPLLDGPLSGPVYLVTNPTSALPDVVADLDGQVHLEVHGATVITNSGRLKNTFASPDVPIDTFTLSFDGGSHGLLVNSTNLCSKKAKKKAFNVKITGQNGAVATSKPKLRKQCS